MTTIVKGDTCCATCSSKPGNPPCPRPAAVVYETKKYCKQHGKQHGWVDPADVPAVPQKAAPAATKKEEPKKEAKKETKKVKEEPKKEKSEEKKDDNTVVMPSESKGLGTCCGQKGNGKGACTNAAKLQCPDTCSCNGKAFCKIHWKTAHKGKVVSDGKGNVSSGRKPVEEDKQCECEKKSGGGGQCGKPAFGLNSNGKRACHTHGGPKKGEVGGSDGASSSANVGGSGLFAGVNWPRLFTRVVKLSLEWAMDETEANAETEAIQWFRELIEMCVTGVPTTESLITHFAKSAWSKKTRKEYAEVYKHTMFFVLRDLLGEADTNFIARMYSNLGKEAGAEAAEVGVIWVATAKECGLPVATAGASTNGSGSSTKGAAVLTSDRKPKTKTLIEKAKAAKAKEEAEEKQKQEKAKEEDEVVTDNETEEDDEEKPAAEPNFDAEDAEFLANEGDEGSISADEDGDAKAGSEPMDMGDDEEFVEDNEE